MYGLGRGDYLNRLLDMRVEKDETKSKAVASLAALPKSPSPTSASGIECGKHTVVFSYGAIAADLLYTNL